METPLFHFILDIALILLSQIPKHLAQNVLQYCLFYRFIPTEVPVLDLVKASIGNIKCSCIAMGRVADRIRIVRSL